MNIFQSPWPLIWVSIVAWLVAAIIRVSFPEKKRPWHMLIPVLIFAAAFGIDHYVKTDLEKIDALIDTGIEATVAADINAIDSIIAEKYSDRTHNSKAGFMATCRRHLDKPQAESIRRSYYNVTINSTTANVELNAIVHLLPQNTNIAGLQILPVKLKIECTRNSEKQWKVSSVDLTEISNHSVNWSDI